MIKIENLKISFGDKKVLDGINLDVPKNSVFGFIGKNGAGKTTTMKIILGFLTPDEGSVLLDGKQVAFGGKDTNKYVGYMPDVPEFYSFMTAREFLTFCAELTNMDKQEAASRVDEMLQLVGLGDETHRIKGFSRGMKQRLGIAQALLNKPKLLICDEPTSALDPIGRKEILDVLKAVSKESTVLFSTHILSDVERICTDVAVLDDGVIKLQGKIDEIKSHFEKGEILMEIEDKNDVNALLNEFDYMHQAEENQLTFLDVENNMYDVLNFVCTNKIALTKLEKQEASLESLVMGVIEK